MKQNIDLNNEQNWCKKKINIYLTKKLKGMERICGAKSLLKDLINFLYKL